MIPVRLAVALALAVLATACGAAGAEIAAETAVAPTTTAAPATTAPQTTRTTLTPVTTTSSTTTTTTLPPKQRLVVSATGDVNLDPTYKTSSRLDRARDFQISAASAKIISGLSLDTNRHLLARPLPQRGGTP